MREKIKQSVFEAKNTHTKNIPLIKKLIDEGKTQKEIGQQLNISQTRVSILLNRLDLSTKTQSFDSKFQREITDFIRANFDGEIISNDRSLIPPFHIDILIPSLNLAIEADGVYWHSETVGRDRKYHLTKTNACKSRGINLIHIWDNEWYSKQDIVKSKLLSLLGKSETIYGRKCKITEVDPKTAKNFLNNNHLQKSVNAKVCLGLTYKDELVALMTFGKSRFGENHWEMLRFCNKTYLTVVGGASKLFSHFVKNYQPTSVVSYCNLRWGTGRMYERLGFQCVKENTGPNYMYFNRNGYSAKCDLFSRMKFQKHKLKDIVDFFDPNLTEWENMQLNGFDRVWDCGNSKWIWMQSC